jgi:hypothetical protein
MALPLSVTALSPTVAPVGPFRAKTGGLPEEYDGEKYFIIGRAAASAWVITPAKATDPTDTFAAGANWIVGTSTSADIRSISAMQVGNIIHVLVSSTNNPPTNTTTRVDYNTFNTSTETWGSAENLITAVSTAGQTGAQVLNAALVVRSSGEVVALLNGLQTKTSGTFRARVYYKRRTAVNTWTADVQVDANTAGDFIVRESVLGAGDVVHLFFFNQTLGQGLARTLSAANALNTVVDCGSVGTSTYDYAAEALVEGANTWVAYAYGNSTSNNLGRFLSAANPTITTGAQNPSGATAPTRIRHDDTDFWAFFRNSNGTGINVSKSTDFGATWSAPVSAMTATVAGARASLSRDGAVYQRGNAVVLPYVVNNGGILYYNEYVIRVTTPQDNVTLTSLTTPGPALPTFGIAEVPAAVILLTGKTVPGPTLPAFAITSAQNLALVGKTVPAPSLAVMAITQVGVIALTGKTTAAPTVPNLPLTQAGNLALQPLTPAFAALPVLSVTIARTLGLNGATVAAPSLPAFGIIEAQLLDLRGVIVGRPTIEGTIGGKIVGPPQLPTFALFAGARLTIAWLELEVSSVEQTLNLVGKVVAAPSLPVFSMPGAQTLVLLGRTIPAPSIPVFVITGPPPVGGVWTPLELGSRTIGLWTAKDAASLTVSGGAVTAWADQTASAYTLLKTSGTATQPALDPNAFGTGQPGIIFNGDYSDYGLGGIMAVQIPPLNVTQVWAFVRVIFDAPTLHNGRIFCINKLASAGGFKDGDPGTFGLAYFGNAPYENILLMREAYPVADTANDSDILVLGQSGIYGGTWRSNDPAATAATPYVRDAVSLRSFNDFGLTSPFVPSPANHLIVVGSRVPGNIDGGTPMRVMALAIGTGPLTQDEITKIVTWMDDPVMAGVAPVETALVLAAVTVAPPAIPAFVVAQAQALQFQPLTVGLLAALPADVIVNVDFLNRTGFVAGTGAVGIETLLGNDPAWDDLAGPTLYDPALITQYGYDLSLGNGYPPAFLGPLLSESLAGKSVVLKFQSGDAGNIDFNVYYRAAGVWDSIYVESYGDVVDAGADTAYLALNGVWFDPGGTSPGVVNVVGFNLLPTIGGRLDVACNDLDAATAPLTADDFSTPFKPIVAGYVSAYGPIVSITVYDTTLALADLRAKTARTLPASKWALPLFAITQAFNVALGGKTVAAPVISVLAINQVQALALTGKTVAAPSLPNFSIAGAGDLTLVGKTVAAPSIAALAVTQAQALQFQPLTVGAITDAVPAGATINVDFIGKTAFVAGTGAVGIETLLGADPNYAGTGYYPDAITQYGYDWYGTGKGNPPAALGALRTAILRGDSTIIKTQTGTGSFQQWIEFGFYPADQDYFFGITELSEGGGGFDSLYFEAPHNVSVLLSNVWQVQTGPNQINVVGFNLVNSNRIDLAANDKASGTQPIADLQTPPANPLAVVNLLAYGPIASITIYPTLALADLRAKTAPVLAAAGGWALPVFTITQAYSLALVGKTVAAPALPALAITQAQALALVGKTVAAPSLPVLAATQAFALALASATVAGPSLPVLVVTQAHALALVGLTTPAPSLPILATVINRNLAFAATTVAAPALPALSVSQNHIVVLASATIAAPTIPALPVSGAGQIAFVGPVTTAPALPTATITQAHVLGLVGLTSPAPALPTPVMTQAYVLGLAGKTTSAPALPAPTITQAHVLALASMATPAPVVPLYAIAGVGQFLLAGKTVATPSLPTPTITQGHALALVGMTSPAPALPQLAPVINRELLLTGQTSTAPAISTLAITQSHALSFVGLTTPAPTISVLSPAAQIALAGLTSPEPAISTLTITQDHALALAGVAVSAPALPMLAPVISRALMLGGTVTAALALDTLAITQDHAVALSTVATGKPALPLYRIAFGTEQDLALGGVIVGAPLLPVLPATAVQTLNLVGKTIAAPALPTFVAPQAQKLTLAGLTVGTPTFPLLFFAQVNVLALGGKTVASPSLPTFPAAITFPLALAGKVVGAPSLPLFGFEQAQQIYFFGKSVLQPQIGTLAIQTAYAAGLVSIVVGRPAIPTFAFEHLVTLSGIATASPILPALTIAQSGTLVFGPVVVARPALPALKIEVEHGLDLRGKTVGTPMFPPLAMIQAQALLLSPFATGPPEFPLYVVSEEVELLGLTLDVPSIGPFTVTAVLPAPEVRYVGSPSRARVVGAPSLAGLKGRPSISNLRLEYGSFVQMATTSPLNFWEGETFPIYFTAYEPDPTRPGQVKVMDLTGAVINLLVYRGEEQLPLFVREGAATIPLTAGKGVIVIQPGDTRDKLYSSKPWNGDYLIDVVRPDNTSVQVAGRVTIRPRPFPNGG